MQMVIVRNVRRGINDKHAGNPIAIWLINNFK